LPQLLDQGLVDLGDSMSKEIAPQRAGTVEIAFAMDIRKPATLCLFDDQTIVFGHLRKGMPDDGPV